MPQVNTMIIPAAGYGTRMREITRGGSKELLEVGGKPAIMYALQEAVQAGLARAGIVIRKGKEDVSDLVQKDSRLAHIRTNLEIRFFYQEKPTGEAGAIAASSEWLGSKPFVVHYPDNIIAEPPGSMEKLIRYAKEQDCHLVLLTRQVEHSQAKPCGLEPAGDGLYIMHPDRTPADFPYGLRPTGIYVAGSHFLQTCITLTEKNQESEVRDQDARHCLKAINMHAYGLDLPGKLLDTGNPDGYRSARLLFRDE